MGCKNTDINNFEVFRGDDFAELLVFADINDEPIDISGWSIFFTLKLRKDDTDEQAAYTWTQQAPSGSIDGKILMNIPGEELNEFVGPYYYDFQFINASGNIQTITSGAITFTKDITRRTS